MNILPNDISRCMGTWVESDGRAGGCDEAGTCKRFLDIGKSRNGEMIITQQSFKRSNTVRCESKIEGMK